MIGYCRVCGCKRKFYNAFGEDDKAVCCTVCKAPRDRMEIVAPRQGELFNRLHQKLETIPERGIDEQGYTLVRYAEVSEMIDKVFQELETISERGG